MVDDELSPDAADEVAISNERRAEKRREREDAKVVAAILATREGRSWLYRRLEVCHIFGASVDLGSMHRPSDPLATYFALGEENIGKRLMAEAQSAASALYLKMIEEARAEEQGRELRQAERAKQRAAERIEEPHLPRPN